MDEYNQIWKVTLAQIEVKLDSPAQFKTWLKDTKLLTIDGKKACIGVKNVYACDWIKKRHHRIIKETISYVYGKPLEPTYKVAKELSSRPTEKVTADEFIKEIPLFGVQNGIGQDLRDLVKKSHLNIIYSFKTFVLGNSNRIAFAASKAVAEKPGQVYNPLFIYGKTGVGKTHLAQAIGSQVLESFPGKKVYYTTSEGFLNDMVKSIKEGKSLDFRGKYRGVDILIIDDIQLISKWVETQSEFFNTYNELHNNGKQIILISDKPPAQISGLEARLKSRFQGGVEVEILPPDFEMRLAIIEKKSNESGISLPGNINEFLAREIKDNVRELEGALQKVSLYNSMHETNLSLEEVARIIGKDQKSKREKIRPNDIFKVISKEFDITITEIKGPRRTANVAIARQICMYILREELGYKLEHIASLLNRNDHTTVIHAIDKIDSKMRLDEGFREQIDMIMSDISKLSA